MKNGPTRVRVYTLRPRSYVKPTYLRVIEGIEDKLHKQADARGYQENEEDIIQVVCDLAENVRDSIIDYQVGPDSSSRPKNEH